jgi:lysozyme
MPIEPITDIYSQLRRDEGVRPFPYTDTAGKLTIGVGRNLTDDGLSNDEIEYLLDADVDKAGRNLRTRLPWLTNLDVVRQGVLLNMCFNLGFSKLEEFSKFLAACAQGDWATAAEEMKNSAWAREVGDRAVRLEEQMRTGVWV